MTNPTVLGKALATLSEMQRGHPQKIQPTLEGNGIYPFPMVVQVHLLKKGIEAVHVHPIPQRTLGRI
jgi:hypothetical protein